MLYFLAGLWYQFSGTDFRRQFLVRVSMALIEKSYMVYRAHLCVTVWSGSCVAHEDTAGQPQE